METHACVAGLASRFITPQNQKFQVRVETMSSMSGRRGVTIAIAVAAVVVVVAGIAAAAWVSRNPGTADPSVPLATQSSLLPSSSEPGGSALPSATPTNPAPSSTPTEGSKGPQDSPAPAPSEEASDGRISVTPSFTSWGSDASGLFAATVLPSIVVEDGTCTLTAISGGTTVSGTAAPERGAADSYCSVTIPAASVSAGEWQVSMSFSSGRYVGTSDTMTVGVQ